MVAGFGPDLVQDLGIAIEQLPEVGQCLLARRALSGCAGLGRMRHPALARDLFQVDLQRDDHVAQRTPWGRAQPAERSRRGQGSTPERAENHRRVMVGAMSQ